MPNWDPEKEAKFGHIFYHRLSVNRAHLYLQGKISMLADRYREGRYQKPRLDEKRIHDRAKSQLRKEGDRQASIRYLADQGAGGARVRVAASDHQEAEPNACGGSGIASGKIWIP